MIYLIIYLLIGLCFYIPIKRSILRERRGGYNREWLISDMLLYLFASMAGWPFYAMWLIFDLNVWDKHSKF